MDLLLVLLSASASAALGLLADHIAGDLRAASAPPATRTRRATTNRAAEAWDSATAL